MFRTLTPNEAFPVVYRRGNVAHLDVTGRRGEAIRAAVHDQLGLQVKEIKPVGLAGSGGSTPLRLCVAGDPDDQWLFAKLYAKSHVRSDRWYKLWRTILYGRLEDETSFQTVRRFVEYEDHMLRLLRDVGVGGADPASGSGLRGLADRIDAAGGRLRVSSPPAGGTSVLAEIPLERAS